MVMASTTLAAYAQKTLTILHTNDTHSCIYPLKATLRDTAIAGRGGFLRRIAMLKEERAKDPDLLLFDSGDFSQGSPFYTLFKGDVEIGLMNKMGYVCSTLGNHEFDFGMDNMARIFKKANFPILCLRSKTLSSLTSSLNAKASELVFSLSTLNWRDWFSPKTTSPSSISTQWLAPTSGPNF